MNSLQWKYCNEEMPQIEGKDSEFLVRNGPGLHKYVVEWSKVGNYKEWFDLSEIQDANPPVEPDTKLVKYLEQGLGPMGVHESSRAILITLLAKAKNGDFNEQV